MANQASRASRATAQEPATPASSEFEASIPVETRIVTAEGVRSARIRNNALRTAGTLLQMAGPVVLKPERNVKAKSKLKTVVIGDDGKKLTRGVREVTPTPVRIPVALKQLEKMIKREMTSGSSAGPGGHRQTSVVLPPRDSSSIKYPGTIVEVTPVTDTQERDTIRVQGGPTAPGQIPQRIPVVTIQTGPPRPALPGLPDPGGERQLRDITTLVVPELTGEYEKDLEDEQRARRSSPTKSDASYHPNEEEEEEEEDEEEVESLNDLDLPEATPRDPSHRSTAPEPEMQTETSVMETIEGDNEDPLPLPSATPRSAYRNTTRIVRRSTPLYPPTANSTRRGRSGWTFGSPSPFRVYRHDVFSNDSLSSSSLDSTYLASKKAFWWAHIMWIAVCFAMTLLLWTLGLSLYWGNRFATIGPPAPCDMTTSVRPFPQTYEESFKIFRRPDVSWDPVVRQQMEDFGNYIGADPWLMDNCILPHNVMKLPLVTCQGRLPWYNLTETQVMWLNENNGWGYNLDWELTEKFNEIFDMQFELQELQTSWMLSDHGPTSPDYGHRRCQACDDIRVRDKEESKETPQWPSNYWNLDPREQALFKRLTNSRTFHQLKKALGMKGNPRVGLINEAATDIPYYEAPPYVGPDMVFTDTDTSSWQPATSAYFAMRNRMWR